MATKTAEHTQAHRNVAAEREYHVIIKYQEVLDKPADVDLVHYGSWGGALALWLLPHDQDCGLNHNMCLVGNHTHSPHKLHNILLCHL